MYGGQRAAQHTLAHEIEVPAVLEHRPADHRVELFTGQTEPVHQTGQRRGEHVLIGRLGVGGVRPRERNPVSADDGDPAVAADASDPTRCSSSILSSYSWPPTCCPR